MIVSGAVIGPVTAPMITSVVSRLLYFDHLRAPGSYRVPAPLMTRPSMPAAR